MDKSGENVEDNDLGNIDETILTGSNYTADNGKITIDHLSEDNEHVGRIKGTVSIFLRILYYSNNQGRNVTMSTSLMESISTTRSAFRTHGSN